MTMGTATVTSTKVRTTGERSRSQLPSNRFRTVKVGKTASQIMTASWCLVGGPTGRALLLTLDMVLLGLVGVGGQRVGKLGGSKVAGTGRLLSVRPGRHGGMSRQPGAGRRRRGRRSWRWLPRSLHRPP